MKKLSLLAVFVVFASTVFAQLSSRLQNAVEENPDAFHQIRIEFKDNIDCYALNHEFKQNGVSVNQRPKQVISQLQEQAKSSQGPVLSLLEGELANDVQYVNSFWIVNTIILQTNANAINELAKVSTVALIDLEDSDIIPHDEIIRGEENAQRAPNGVEPGLVAINAQPMWNLGYTGRGTIGYCYDTGVWPNHPAFAYRFLANRYPLAQCWTGFFSDEPNGAVSDHGTHVLGTMAGLVEETNDTIGVAFESYWIANDFVTSTVEALPPLAAMISAFEWALNPDGDINSTEDIPDVINNSWRWRDDPDTVQCAGMVVNLMNAIEAAGIANIFSGGNSGPNNSTVNAPQRINTSEVNTFSVGSVNGNAAFPHPISNFSTRGPKQCPSGGNLSLEIHPEVVAPGQSVRSAWGQDEYNSISGTSMASPHVSGAILLLKEAFPDLSGEDLMWALYQTAVDLGDPGEDNTFGMGIIDVYAAYQQLAQTHTPVDPNAIDWDLEITGATNPFTDGYTCSNELNTSISFKNRGDNDIFSIEFTYSVNGGPTSTETWTGTLSSGDEATLPLPTITLTEYGPIDVMISATIGGNPAEYDYYNNRWRLHFNHLETKELPFTEGFEQGFQPNGWIVTNNDFGITWGTFATSGLDWSEKSARVNLYSYSPRQFQKDWLTSPPIQFPTTSEPIWLLFDVAYQMRNENDYFADTLNVFIGGDCGPQENLPIYTKAGFELSTQDSSENNFTPEFAWDWRTDSVNLSSFSGEISSITFETINKRGNNVYIDNIRVFAGNNEPSRIDNLDKLVSLYPNPATNEVYVQLKSSSQSINNVRLLNVVGAEVNAPIVVNGNQLRLATNHLTPGMYMVDVWVNNHRVVKRFVKQ